MDNLTHSLCGLALARAGGQRLGVWATPTLVIAANLPDIDILGLPLWGKTYYLEHHRGITHSLAGFALLAPMLALLMVWLHRRWRRSKGEPARFFGLFAAAWLGLLSHLALDALNNYGVRPWLPFDATWYYGDLVFIIEPWLWLGFGLSACLGSRSERNPDLGWGLMALGGVALMLLSGRVPRLLVPLWAGALLAALGLRRRGLPARWLPRAARAALVLSICYLGVLAWCGARAEGRAREHLPGGQEMQSTRMPTPGQPWRYRIALADSTHVYWLRVNLLRRRVHTQLELERGLDDPRLADARHSEQYRVWQLFARLPFAARNGEGLVLGDARYSPQPEASWCNFLVPLPR